MKRILIVTASVMLVAILVIGVSPAMAGKPQAVIEKSNGYPSGPHFNLNIHGKRAGYDCDPTPGGGSVFICEDGKTTIQYVTNRKSSLAELIALDPCSECFDDPPDDDPVKVMLPYEEDGYFVFARLRGKPNNGQNAGDPSYIAVNPANVLQACNDTTEDPEFPNYTECMLPLGFITVKDLYVVDGETFVRFDPAAIKGKGKAKAVDITPLFKWFGWVCDAILDTNEDGVIDAFDVPIGDYDIYDTDDSGDIEWDELEVWLDAQGECTYHEDEWILNIADLVIADQEIDNDGAKLFKIRFYPVATTEFIPAE